MDESIASMISSVMNSITLEDEQEYKKREEKQKEKEKQDAYEKSGVGKKYWNYRLSDFVAETEEQKKCLLEVTQYIQDLQNGKVRTLWLCGNSGTGKTMLACLIVRECGGFFCKSYQIADEIDDTRSFSSKESKSGLIYRYSNYKLLVIDEVGKFQNGKTEIDFLFRILNERYERELPTVIITNMTKHDLRDYIGKPLYDRFVENCISIEFWGESYRIQKRLGE